MAVTINTLHLDIQEYNDARKVIIMDGSTCDGDGDINDLILTITAARITISSDNDMNGAYIDLLELIDNVVKARFIALFDTKVGLYLQPSDFREASKGVQITDTDKRFDDGAYTFTLSITIGATTYTNFKDYPTGFIAYAENAIQRYQLNMAGSALDRFVNLHIYTYCARSAASSGKLEIFSSLVETINNKITNYASSFV
jgi:hypothetical protein